MGIRRLAVLAATVVLVLGLGGHCAVAVPPPPPNPSDAEIEGSKAAASSRAAHIGQLTNEVAQAQASLVTLRSAVEIKLEEANKAQVDLRTATEAAERARAEAETAKIAAKVAADDVDRARAALDEFAASSYRQGSAVGSVSAYLGASSPRDVLDRATLLNTVAGSQLDSLDDIRAARTQLANKESAARAALAVADDKQERAEQARAAADAAMAAAQQAQRDQLALTERLRAGIARAEQQLARARAQVGGLENQRERYRDWLAAKQSEDAAEATQATTQTLAGGGGADTVPAAPSSIGAVRTVINRALSQRGVPYAWGGGDANGPTRGIRDGGVADAHGDYNKIGFDCSGLMIYAFAGVGILLPHYSGYQHEAGRKVPLSEKRPGDMLFWASGGRIHHVALYIGSGKMVEAPYSGSHVRVTSVRYGGIVPLATRLL